MRPRAKTEPNLPALSSYEKRLKTRVHNLYSGMRKRFGAKYWRTGRRKGMLREPGTEIPFSERDLLRWMVIHFDGKARNCPYCRVPVDAFTASLDHGDPVSRGGGLGLDNLLAPCADCNRMKGPLTVKEFCDLLDWLDKQHPAAQQDIRQRLKAGAMGIRLRFHR